MKAKVSNHVRILFPEQAKTVDEGKSPFCEKGIDPDIEFRDNLSVKEYHMSGICQTCQDGIFHD